MHKFIYRLQMSLFNKKKNHKIEERNNNVIILNPLII